MRRRSTATDEVYHLDAVGIIDGRFSPFCARDHLAIQLDRYTLRGQIEFIQKVVEGAVGRNVAGFAVQMYSKRRHSLILRPPRGNFKFTI